MNSDDLSICEWEAIAFFGSEHSSRAYGTEWYDSDSVYEVSDQRGLKLACAIHPIHRDVRLRLSLDECLIFEWQAQDLQDICYVEEKDRTVIRFVVTDRDILTLRVTPCISISRSTGRVDAGHRTRQSTELP
jgi:hypothetical protein